METQDIATLNGEHRITSVTCATCRDDIPESDAGANSSRCADRPADARLLDPFRAKLDSYASLDKLEGFSSTGSSPSSARAGCSRS